MAGTATSHPRCFRKFIVNQAAISDGFDKLENQSHRFGEFQIHPTLPHLVVCVLEDHTKPAPADVVNTLVLIDTEAQSFTTLAEGADFYAFGRFSPDGTKLAWIQWSVMYSN
jgi:hypothetical protein